MKNLSSSFFGDWSNKGAPFPTQTFAYYQLLWIPFLAAIAKQSIYALNKRSFEVNLFWIVYESYILFDHTPFIFTNCVYKSPRINFTYLSSIFFWGLEAVASIVATQSHVKAPSVLLYNVAPHCFFIAANNFYGKAASKAFLAEERKTWWVYCQVIIDTTIHAISLWCQLKYFFSGEAEMEFILTALSFVGLASSMCVLTYVVHKDEMSLRYFLVPLKEKLK
jgi:hypothetical protein